jgi:hypothetical protein
VPANAPAPAPVNNKGKGKRKVVQLQKPGAQKVPKQVGAAAEDDPEDIEIGSMASSLTLIDTATELGVNGVVMEKAKMAQICGCGPDDKCWALAFSTKPWPNKLEYCPYATQPGHEAHDSAKHTFTPAQMLRLRRLVRGK